MSKSIAFPYLSVQDVARAADLSVPAIYKHIEAGHIEVIKLPNFKNYLIPAAALAAFLKARAHGKFVRPPKKLKA
jgi:excisionase family DNA binding protein